MGNSSNIEHAIRMVFQEYMLRTPAVDSFLVWIKGPFQQSAGVWLCDRVLSLRGNLSFAGHLSVGFIT
jgi:hypothetical protein